MSTTTNKSLTQPVLGSTSPNWGTLVNADLGILDSVLGNAATFATLTGDHVLTTDEIQSMCVKTSTSAFTGNVTLTIPSGVAGQWVVMNQSAASSFTLTVRSANVATTKNVTVERNSVRSIYCDGTDVFYADTPFTGVGTSGQVIYNDGTKLVGSDDLLFDGTNLSIGKTASISSSTTSGPGPYVATVTFPGTKVIPVGSTVTVGGVTPSGYNGNWVVTSSSAGSVTFSISAALVSGSGGIISYGDLSADYVDAKAIRTNTLEANSAYGNIVATGPQAAAGTANEVLLSPLGAMSFLQANNLNQGAATDWTDDTFTTLSGNVKEFIGIPSWAKRVKIILKDVRSNTASDIIVQAGSSSFSTAGYASSAGGINGGTGQNYSTSGIVVTLPSASANPHSGMITFDKLNGSNTWVESGSLMYTSTGAIVMSSGYTPELSGAMDRIRIKITGSSYNFTAGTIGVVWE